MGERKGIVEEADLRIELGETVENLSRKMWGGG